MKRTFTFLMTALFLCVGMVKAAVTDVPEMSTDGDIKWYTISNTRSASGKYLYWTANGVKDANTLSGASLFYFTGESGEACFIHNAATELLFSGAGAWTAEGVSCKISETPHSSKAGVAIEFSGTALNEQNQADGFTTWSANDAGSIFVISPATVSIEEAIATLEANKAAGNTIMGEYKYEEEAYNNLVAALATLKTAAGAEAVAAFESCVAIMANLTYVMPEAGKFYVIECPIFKAAQGVSKGLNGTPGWNTIDLTDTNYYWTVEVNDGTYALKNLGTGTYLNGTAMSESAAYAKLTSLGEQQFNIVVNGTTIHANGHNGGAAASGNLVSWAGSANSASAWMFIEKADPTSLVEVAVTYSLTYGGEEKYTQTVSTLVGEEWPAITVALPYGVSASKPEGTIAAEDHTDGAVTKVIELTVAELPFVAAEDVNSIEQWYHATMHSNYPKYIEENADGSIDWVKESIEDDNAETLVWGFVGNVFDGIKVVNKGTGHAIVSTSGAAVMGDAANATAFILSKTDTGVENGFCLKYPGSNYLNASAGKVSSWSAADAGSTFLLYPYVAVDPNDFTSFIANADLSTEEAWNTDGTKGIKDGMVKVSSEAAFDFCQTITLPAGQYKVTAKAAYRYAGDEQAEYDAIQVGTNTHLVKLYAETAFKNYEVNVMNRYDGASDTDYADGNGSKTVNGKFVPNSSAAVQAWFDNGQYVNELVINVQEEGAVKIGITRVGGIAGDYVNLGAWTLTRLGDAEFDLNEADFDLDAPAYTDVTAQYIVNADFSTGDGWTGGSINTGDRVCEFYAGWGSLDLTSGKLQQEVTLPAGEYRLTAKAFFRQGQSSYTNPSKSMGYLFAGDNKVLVQTLGSVPGLGSYADNQGQAGTAFYTDNLYDNVLEFTLAEETTLNIGFETTFDEMKSWFIAGAVKLESVQPVPGALKPIFEAQAMEFCQYSNTAMSALPAVYAKWEALSTTVNEIYGAISADKKVLDIEVKRVMAEMTAMVAELEAIDEAYATYNDAKWAIFDVQDNSTPNNDDAKAAFDAAVEEACNVAEVATVADLEAKIAAFEAARQAYVLNALPKEGFAFDYTFKLANPSFETGNMDGWTLNYSADTGAKHNSGGYATGNTHGNYLFNSWWKGVYLSQEVGEVPNGKYTLTVAMAGGDSGNDATAYVIANTDTVGVNLVSGEAFKDVKVDFLVINGRIHVATVGGNDDDTAERPLGTFNQEGYWWYKADNFRLEYVGELPLEVLLSMKKEVFLAKYAEFEALTETLDYSWNAINNNYYFSVQEAAMGVKDTIDNVTELAVLDEMMAAMDESVANLAKVGVAAVDYNYFKGLLEEAIGFSTMVNEEECMAAYNVFEQYGGMMFGYTASTVEDIENAAAELKAAYIKFVSNAVPAEGTMFDMTFAIQNPSFNSNIDGWTCVNAGHNGGAGYNNVGGLAEIALWGATSWEASISQTLENLPNGTYVVKAAWMAASGIEMTFSANEGNVTVTGIGDQGGNIANDGSVVEMGQGFRGWQYVEVEGNVEDGVLTIAVNSSSSAQYQWSNADEFELYYAGVPEVVEPEYLAIVSAVVGEVALVEGTATVQSISTIDVTFDCPVALAENAGWATLEDKWGPTNLDAEVLAENACVVRFTVSAEFNGEFTDAGEYYLNIPEGFIVGAEDANYINAAIEAVITIEAAPATPLTVVNVTVGEDVMADFSAIVATPEAMIKVNFDGKFYFQGVPVIVDAEGNDASDAFEFMNGLDYDGTNSYIFMGSKAGIYTITLAKESFMEYEMMGWKAPAEDIVLTVQILDKPQGIDNIAVDADAVIYDIHGRRVEKMEKGIYIVNGKKVIKK